MPQTIPEDACPRSLGAREFAWVFDFNLAGGQSAGNFEREFCGFVTGHCDSRGDDEALAARAALSAAVRDWLDEHVVHLERESGAENAEPCSLWPSPPAASEAGSKRAQSGGHPRFDSVAIFFDEAMPDDALAACFARAKTYAASQGIELSSARWMKAQKEVVDHEELYSLHLDGEGFTEIGRANIIPAQQASATRKAKP